MVDGIYDGAAVFWNKGDLDFNLSSAGLALTGMTNSASDLKAYIAKLEALVALLPDDKTEHSPQPACGQGGCDD
jgi:hypothetical protein